MIETSSGSSFSHQIKSGIFITYFKEQVLLFLLCGEGAMSGYRGALTPSGKSGEVKPRVQMRFGTELNWEGQPSTVLMFYFQEDIPLQDSHRVHLNG